MAVVAERVADVRGRHTDWMWGGWFPVGALSLIGGAPGTAKSMISVWIAAKVTRGLLSGAWHGKPRNVLIISSEDDLADTIKPRFMAAEGDPARAFFVDPGTIGLELPRGVDDLRDFAVENAISLIVLDPVAARLSDGLNANNDKDVRRALEPLVGMLRDLRAVALGIMHMRKATTVDSVSAMMGSMAFVGLARSVAATFEDDDGSFLFASAKMNLGKKPDSLRYEVNSTDVAEDDEIIETAKVRFLGTTDRTADDVLIEKAAKLAGRPVKKATAVGNAADFLREILASGPRLQADVAAAAGAAGHAPRTLARAKASLGVMSRKLCGSGAWTWELRHPYDLEDGPDDLG